MLLSTIDFRNQLEGSLNSSKGSTIVLSGFIKKEALSWLIENCGSESVKVISRWRKHDIICGASDFACYELCKNAGADFGISSNLHGKVFCVDQKIYVGSHNLTSRGMALSSNFNDEFGIGFKAGDGDKTKIQNYLQNVTWVNDDIAQRIEGELNETPDKQLTSEMCWSTDLLDYLKTPVTHLWMHELLFCKPTELMRLDTGNEYQLHDFQLLNLNIDNITLESLKAEFMRSNCFRWLDSFLNAKGSMHFGRVSASLHSSILDDQTPYRRDIKHLVSNLFAWFEILEGYKVSTPRHSQVIEKLKI